MVELVVRLVFSLAVVIGMVLLLTKFSAKRFRGGADALVRVIHRQPLSRTSAVAVVTVGSRVLVVGTTEHQVQLLTELDPEEIELPVLELAAFEAAGLESAAVETPAFEEPVAPRAASEATALSVVPEVFEYSTLDELLQPAGPREHADPDGGEASYTPRHAGRPAAPAITRGRSTRRATTASRSADGALAGSLLSAQTWKQAFAAASRPRDAS